ncbi:hypothetical protein FHS43_002661 [Streptosporangium becharense]|uniref:Uncharacterized protein n=1 Tax=Streptosporangium becharense TaxID=1816182 RepID=A0A7W9MIF4_9ACTN|nr:hypothetical protein [Streptosporangium becharense]MBB2911396.1 hypothetical protein [Streptosporangium becharense]MBB5821546.1 hypothetical protein [Streptosporangium becharense]
MNDRLDEPIVDPAVPEPYRRKIVVMPFLLYASSEPSARRRRFYTVGGAVTGVAGLFMAGMAIKLNSPFSASASFLAIVAGGFFVNAGRPGLAEQLRSRYGDCYVLPADLDDDTSDLVRRARQAIKSVSASRVNRLGLLDYMVNDVVLPERLWDIARLLRAQEALRAEQVEAMSEVMTPELAVVLAPQQEALSRSTAAVTDQVLEHEEYARRVQKAGAALQAHELLKSNDRYRDLLARTDDAQGLRNLTENVDALGITLAENLRDAISAGRTLTAPRNDAEV